MISSLEGTISLKSEKYAIIETGGIGFKVFCSEKTLSSIPQVGESVKLHTYLSVKETAWDLFGFLSLEEIELFELLISISGIGPKTAAGILSGASVEDIQEAIVLGDETILSRVSGIGKKVAQKIVIEDSKEGWCKAFVEACTAWEKGKDVELDYSLIRPAGAKLATMGGRASGPAPLQELMQFTKRKMLAKQGRRLTTLDLHDIICQIGLIVVAGGVRRSALISLSSLDDTDIRDAKKGTFWQTEGQRSMANNSAVYEAKPTAEEFMQEWTSLVTSHSGERGIFNRGGLQFQVPKRRWEVLKKAKLPGVNPCGEIYLQSKQFCNLTQILKPQERTDN